MSDVIQRGSRVNNNCDVIKTIWGQDCKNSDFLIILLDVGMSLANAHLMVAQKPGMSSLLKVVVSCMNVHS